MPAVVRDLALERCWVLPAERTTSIGGRHAYPRVDIALDSWVFGRTELKSDSGAWSVRMLESKGFQQANLLLSMNDRKVREPQHEWTPLAPGDLLLLGRVEAFFFFVEDSIRPDALEALDAARPLFEAARGLIAAEQEYWAGSAAKRFGECRDMDRAEVLGEFASAAALDTGSPGRRSAAIGVLAELGRLLPALVRPLRTILSDPDEVLRIGAARALARIGGPHVVDALAAALADANDRVFLTALAAIERSRDAAFRPALHELFRSANGKRREHVERVLVALSRG